MGTLAGEVQMLADRPWNLSCGGGGGASPDPDSDPPSICTQASCQGDRGQQHSLGGAVTRGEPVQG